MQLNFSHMLSMDIMMPEQNGRHIADDIFKRIFFNENSNFNCVCS